MSVFHTALNMDYDDYDDYDANNTHIIQIEPATRASSMATLCEYFIPEPEKASLFIPYLHPALFLPEDDPESIQKNLANILNGVGLFNIKRIDVAQHVKNPKKMAFVHFYCWQKNNTVDCIRNMIDMVGFYQIDLNIVSRNLPTRVDGYIRLYYNKNPIPEIKTELNNVQLAAALADVDEKLKESEITISKQRLQIERLTKENEEQLEQNFQLALSLGESEQQVLQLKQQLRHQKSQYDYVYSCV